MIINQRNAKTVEILGTQRHHIDNPAFLARPPRLLGWGGWARDGGQVVVDIDRIH